MAHYLLLYQYGNDIVNRRQPYRQEHLALLRQLHADGSLVMAGAFSDPLDAAALVFKGDDTSAVEGFVKADPYVTNGLVVGWRIRQWDVVVGGD